MRKKIQITALLAVLLLSSCLPAGTATPTAKPTAIPVTPSRTPLVLGFQAFTDTPIPTPVTIEPRQPTSTRALGIQIIPPERTSGPTLAIPVENLPGADCIPAGAPEYGQVVEILSGDSIRVVIDGITYRVHYMGLSAPQEIYNRSQSALGNAQLAYGKTVALYRDYPDKDETGALLRYVIADNTFINLKLISQGHAQVATTLSGSACDSNFLAEQTKAAQSQIGMWAPPNITPGTPWPVCDCNKDKYNCTKQFFYSQKQAQSCFDYCGYLGAGDIHGLDRDGNGIACDQLLPSPTP